ncbi:MAG: polysaccharide deacetylase family protein [Planctomycetota bacterium]|jgi:peptidoglycan/xylan/chitin deacetylase (PgdA/CDA1 family)
MEENQRSLVEQTKHAKGRYGGFSFAGQLPEGVTANNPLSKNTIFPNGAKAALLMTFDVEGTYGNGTGDMDLEISNYKKICDRLKQNNIPATFNIVGQMAEEQDPEFIKWMLKADCEVAAHGYVHDMNKLYGGDYLYAGHYGPEENLEQIRKGVEAINKIHPDSVNGVRVPYSHFNEYTYDAIEKAGLKWTSNLGSDDFVVPGQGFGSAPFQIQLGDKLYPIIEIPIDSQTYDWPIWVADEKSNEMFLKAVKYYCDSKNIPFERTPKGAAAIWQQRIRDTLENQTVFTFICHPINLTVKSKCWSDPLTEFLFPVIDKLGKLNKEQKAWVCTCNQMADFYRQTMNKK